MSRTGLVVVLVAGCGFQIPGGTTGDGGPPDPDAGDGGTPDGVDPDGSNPMTCRERWTAHQIAFGNPALIPGVPTAGKQTDPFLADDELDISFVWNGDIGGNDDDLYSGARGDPTAAFAGFAPAFVSNASANDSKAAASRDTLVIVVASERPGGVAGSWDLWLTRRPDAQSGFPAVSNTTNISNPNTGVDELDPFLNDDGTRLYYAVGLPAQTIAVASRASATVPFSLGVAIEGLNSTTIESNADPALTPDELLILFTSSRTAPIGGGNLWYATRPSLTDPFDAPRLVPGVNTDAMDGDPHLSSDGCRLYFASTRGGSSDLYVATMQ